MRIFRQDNSLFKKLHLTRGLCIRSMIEYTQGSIGFYPCVISLVSAQLHLIEQRSNLHRSSKTELVIRFGNTDTEG